MPISAEISALRTRSSPYHGQVNKTYLPSIEIYSALLSHLLEAIGGYFTKETLRSPGLHGAIPYFFADVYRASPYLWQQTAS